MMGTTEESSYSRVLQIVAEKPSESLFPRRDVFYDDLPSHHFDSDLYILSQEDLLERRNRLCIDEAKDCYVAEKQVRSHTVRRLQRIDKDASEKTSIQQPLSQPVERRHKSDERKRSDKRRSKSIDNPAKISSKISAKLPQTENVPKRRSRSVCDDKKDKPGKRSSRRPAELRDTAEEPTRHEKYPSKSIDKNPTKTSVNSLENNPDSLLLDRVDNFPRRMPVDEDEMSNNTIPIISVTPLSQRPKSNDSLGAKMESRTPNARYTAGLFNFESKAPPKRRQSISVDHTIGNNPTGSRDEYPEDKVEEFCNVQETSVTTVDKKFRRRGSLASAFSFRMKRASALPQRQGGNRRSTNDNNAEVGVSNGLLSKQRSKKSLLDVGMHDRKTTTDTPIRRMSMDMGSTSYAAPVQASGPSVSCLQLTVTGEAVMATITSPDFTTL